MDFICINMVSFDVFNAYSVKNLMVMVKNSSSLNGLLESHILTKYSCALYGTPDLFVIRRNICPFRQSAPQSTLVINSLIIS